MPFVSVMSKFLLCYVMNGYVYIWPTSRLRHTCLEQTALRMKFSFLSSRFCDSHDTHMWNTSGVQSPGWLDIDLHES
jgi:hypothetical protein